MEKLEALAATQHPYASAIADLIANEGDNLRNLLVFSSSEHDGITTVQVKDTNISTQFADLDESESSPLTEHTLVSAH